VTKFSKD
jgi:hypothetical protein